jgi:uncharacterized protein
MMLKANKKGLIILMILLTSLSLWALKVPKLDGPVVDEAGLLSNREEQALEEMILNLERSTSAQVAVLTIAGLKGEALESYSIQVADEWKLGQADRDNGALLLVALEERKVRIEVGYGLEGSLTDMKSGYIIREIILPRFKAGNYAGGIEEGVRAMTGVISGASDISEAELAKYQKSTTTSQSRSSSGGISFNFLFFFLILIFSSLGRRGRGRGGLFRALFWGSVLSNSTRGRGGFGGSSSGFSSGGGGGGFSGGGGGFGGGGASGGW